MLYNKFRFNAELSTVARDILVMLSSLSGDALDGYDSKVSYKDIYVENFFNLVSIILDNAIIVEIKNGLSVMSIVPFKESCNSEECRSFVDSTEALSVAYIFDNLISYFGAVISSSSEEKQTLFLDMMTNITVLIAEETAREEFNESNGTNVSQFSEALEELFLTWNLIMKSKNSLFSLELKEYCFVTIFDTYISYYLSQPYGSRTKIKNVPIICRKNFYPILGKFLRRIMNHSLPKLAHLLEKLSVSVKNDLYRSYEAQFMNSSENTSREKSIDFDNLYEDLHWLVIFSGHLLCKNPNDEISSCFRYECTIHLKLQDCQMDLKLLLKLLESLETVEDLQWDVDTIDQVTRLTADLLKLCKITLIAIEFNLNSHQLSKLCGTLVCFLHRWSLIYLEHNFFESTERISNSDGYKLANESLSFVIKIAQCYLVAFKNEPIVVKNTTELLNGLSSSTHLAKKITKLKNYRELLHRTINNPADFPREAKQSIMHMMIEVGYSFNDGEKMKEYYVDALSPLLCRFQNLFYANSFTENAHQEDVRVQVAHIFECLAGTGNIHSNVNIIYEFMNPIFESLSNLFNIYQDDHQYIILVILEFYLEYSHLSFYFYTNYLGFLEIFEKILKIYEENDRMIKLINEFKSNKQDDVQREILLLIKIFINIIKSRPGRQNVEQLTFDISFIGLNIILPGIQNILLASREISLEYFKFTEQLCALCREKICTMPAEKFKFFTTSLEIGIVSFGLDQEIIVSCLTIIKILAGHIYKEKIRQIDQYMIPFLNLFLKLIVMRQTSSDTISHMRYPLFYLICCYKEEYHKFVKDIVKQEKNSSVVQEAFEELTDEFGFTMSFGDEKIFSANFKDFVNYFSQVDPSK